MKCIKDNKIKNLRLNLLCLSMLVSGVSISTTCFNMAKFDSYATEEEVIFTDVEEPIVANEFTEEEVEEPITEVESTEEVPLPDPIDRWEIGGENIIVVIPNSVSYDVIANQYITEHELINADKFVVTSNNKTYEYLSDDDFRFFASIVATETSSNEVEGNPLDAITVGASILNRCDNSRWVNYLNANGYDGSNPIDQMKYPGQYTACKSKKFYRYYNGEVEIPAPVLAACEATWYGGIRNHNYCSFRARGCKSYSNNQIVDNGNRFGDEIKEEEKILVK